MQININVNVLDHFLRKHFHSSTVLKITLKTAKRFPQRPIMTQNPPYNTLATVHSSKIERPDPRVTHHDVYHEIDCNQPPKRKLGQFSWKNLFKKNAS